MSIRMSELLGEKLLQHAEPNRISSSQLNGKTVCLYFSFVALEVIDVMCVSVSCFPVLIGVLRVVTSLQN